MSTGKIIKTLESINEKLGKAVSGMVVLLMLLIGLDVIFRYLFHFTFIWITELEIYFFGLLFLLASGYTYKHNKHVRVDVFYGKSSEKRKAWIDLIGTLGLFIPWCYVVMVSAWHYGMTSLVMNEGSPQAGGLPALYILKFSIPVGFGFLSLQGLACALKTGHYILYKKNHGNPSHPLVCPHFYIDSQRISGGLYPRWNFSGFCLWRLYFCTCLF